MPMLSSRNFGPVEYQEESVFEFPAGLPGFEEERRFVPIEHAASKPIVFLQSLNRPSLCFITLPVLAVRGDFSLAISAEDLRTLELPEKRQPAIGAEVLCLAILSVAEGHMPTANLLAPVVVNLKTRRGLQSIQVDSSYSHQHPVLTAER